MAKQTWKPGNMLYPLPAVMVSVTDGEGNDNIITVAWAGTVCTNPPMVSISVRPSRFSYDMICKTKEFVLFSFPADLPVLVLYGLVGLIISAVLHEFLQFFHALLGGFHSLPD